jgi:hypothetical protein
MPQSTAAGVSLARPRPAPVKGRKVKDGHPLAGATRNRDAGTMSSNRSVKPLRKAESEAVEGSYSLFSVRCLMSCRASSSRMDWRFTLNCSSGALLGGR